MRTLLALSLLCAACGVSAAPDVVDVSVIDSGACEPACRTGFACVRGACVSACNPPCGPAETCTAAATCAMIDAGTDAVIDARVDAVDTPDVSTADVIPDTGRFPNLLDRPASEWFSSAFQSVCTTMTGCVVRDYVVVDTDPIRTGCRWNIGDRRLDFNASVCTATTPRFCAALTGYVYADPAGGDAMGGVDWGSGFNRPPMRISALQRGPRYPDLVLPTLSRMNFWIQFTANSTAATTGAAGISGVTYSATSGDLWLMGCPVY